MLMKTFFLRTDDSRKTSCEGLGQGNAGFTIISVLIAISIFAIGVLAVASMQTDASRLNRSATLRSMALSVASEEMDIVMAQDYFTIGNDNYVVDREGFTFDVEINVIDDDPIPDTKTVTVTVEWTDRGEQTITLNTIIADL